MTSYRLRARTLNRIIRSATVSTLAVTIGLGIVAPPTAWASGSTAGSGTNRGPTAASLQVQAQELAGQIAADGRTLDELDASYNAAEIRYQNLQSQENGLKLTMAKTAAEVTTARNQLKSQAILAYVTGGTPVLIYRSDRPGEDPSLVTSYAEIVAGGEKRAEDSYRADLNAEASQKSQLDATSHQAAITLAAIRSDVTAANVTLAARKRALAEVTGQLGAAVAEVQQSTQQAQQASVETQLARQGQLPPGSATVGPSASPAAEPQPTAPPSTPGPRPTPATRPAAPPPTARTTVVTRPTPTNPPTPTTQPPPPPPPPVSNYPAPGSGTAIAYAEAQLGKPYQWGGAGPNSFDCSGLVMMAWARAGVYFPHLAQDQYNMTRRIPIGSLLPGDIVFFGTPDNVYHDGLYIGSGEMIDAPETGQNVSIQSIFWSTLLGGGRV